MDYDFVVPDFVNHTIRLEKDLTIFRFHSLREFLRPRSSVGQGRYAFGCFPKLVKDIACFFEGVIFCDPTVYLF